VNAAKTGGSIALAYAGCMSLAFGAAAWSPGVAALASTIGALFPFASTCRGTFAALAKTVGRARGLGGAAPSVALRMS
jgi:hypothetical protein